MRIAIDFDDTIFNKKTRAPMEHAVETINQMVEDGHQITIFTNRPDYQYPDVEAMLKAWGVRYDRIICGKPSYDVFIDDKALHFTKWIKQERKKDSE